MRRDWKRIHKEYGLNEYTVIIHLPVLITKSGSGYPAV